MNLKLLVVGGTPRQFDQWCEDHHINARDTRVKHLRYTNELFGWHDLKFIVLGYVAGTGLLKRNNELVANWSP